MDALADVSDDVLRKTAILADACLVIESARLYGFIEGGPTVDVERCEAVVAYAHERGLVWTEDERTAAAVQLGAGS